MARCLRRRARLGNSKEVCLHEKWSIYFAASLQELEGQ